MKSVDLRKFGGGSWGEWLYSNYIRKWFVPRFLCCLARPRSKHILTFSFYREMVVTGEVMRWNPRSVYLVGMTYYAWRWELLESASVVETKKVNDDLSRSYANSLFRDSIMNCMGENVLNMFKLVFCIVKWSEMLKCPRSTTFQSMGIYEMLRTGRGIACNCKYDVG